MDYYCNACGTDKVISKKVYEYSTDKFNRPLCMDCQDKLRNSEGSALQDIGTLTEKFGDTTKKVHEQGGLPLTLVFIGGLLFLLGIALPILFGSSVPWWVLVIVYVLSVGLIGLGVWLYLKDKKDSQ